MAPATASAIPRRSVRPGCSPSHSAATAHANTGFSETSNTELATDVNLSDAIHVQKCVARSSPERSINGNASRTARVGCRSRVATPNVTGSTRTSRQNAIATAGAAANRTIGPAYVVARTATMRTSSGDIGGTT